MKKIEKLKILGITERGKWYEFAQKSLEDIYELKLKINELINAINSLKNK